MFVRYRTTVTPSAKHGPPRSSMDENGGNGLRAVYPPCPSLRRFWRFWLFWRIVKSVSYDVSVRDGSSILHPATNYSQSIRAIRLLPIVPECGDYCDVVLEGEEGRENGWAAEMLLSLSGKPGRAELPF